MILVNRNFSIPFTLLNAILFLMKDKIEYKHLIGTLYLYTIFRKISSFFTYFGGYKKKNALGRCY